MEESFYPREGNGPWSEVLTPAAVRGAQFIPLFSPTLEVGSVPHICAPKGGRRVAETMVFME